MCSYAWYTKKAGATSSGELFRAVSLLHLGKIPTAINDA